MTASYQTLTIAGGDAYVTPRGSAELSKVDCVVFDCDGTLIDVRDSYDATIVQTVLALVEEFAGEPPAFDSRTGPELILQVRRTGGFNSDWDTTYALTVFSVLALEESRGDGRVALERLRSMLEGFCSTERLSGYRDVDEYVDSSGLGSKRLVELRRYLGYPGTPRTSRLASTFDELYYGEDLYRRVYGAEPRKKYGKGLIEKERVIVTERSLQRIGELVGQKRMALATGRPFVAVEHTLGPLLSYFERRASVFIGDGDIFPELAPKLANFKKPSGASLLLAEKVFDSRVMLYVGDSAEDRLMVRDALPRSSGKMLFAGIYGDSPDERGQISFFSREGSDVVVRDANQISEVLEVARA